jgi:hypothetical protein
MRETTHHRNPDVNPWLQGSLLVYLFICLFIYSCIHPSIQNFNDILNSSDYVSVSSDDTDRQ